MVRISHAGIGLFLKTPSLGDAECIAENANDSELLDMVPSLARPFGVGDAIQLVGAAIGREPLGEFHLGIYDDSNALIGMCAVSSIDSESRSAEIGYWIGRRHWGRGLGGRAVGLLAGFCFSGLGLETVCAKTFSRNERSVRLLERLGFSTESECEEGFNGKAERVMLMRLYAKNTPLKIRPDISWKG